MGLGTSSAICWYLVGRTLNFYSVFWYSEVMVLDVHLCRKPVDLIFYQNDLIIRDVTVSTVRLSQKWKVDLVVFCEGPLRAVKDITGQIEFALFVKNGKVIRSSVDVTLSSDSKSREVSVLNSISVPEVINFQLRILFLWKCSLLKFAFKYFQDIVDLWWPNGYGDQNLFRLSVSFTNGAAENNKTIMIGFRTVKLVQELVNATNPDHGA